MFNIKEVKAYIEQPQSLNPGPDVIADVCITQHTGQRLGLLTEGVSYWLKHFLCLLHAVAIVEIVLLRSDKEANAIYSEIVQAIGRPGCQNFFKAASPYWPNTDEVLFELIRANKAMDKAFPMRAPAQAKKPPNASLNALYSDFNLWAQSDKCKQRVEHLDFQHFQKLIDKFILAVFNRKKDQDNKVWKVTRETLPYQLILSVIIAAATVEYGKRRQQDSIQNKVQVENNLYDFDYKMPRNPRTRKERSIRSAVIKDLKYAGFVLRHNPKLLQDADQWYKCRVNPGSITDYLNERADQDPPKIIERARVSLDLAPYDEVTGYPRQWRK